MQSRCSLTNTQVEKILQGFEEIGVALVLLEIDLSEVRSSVHAHFHELSQSFGHRFLHLQIVFPVGPDWRPPHYLGPGEHFGMSSKLL